MSDSHDGARFKQMIPNYHVHDYPYQFFCYRTGSHPSRLLVTESAVRWCKERFGIHCRHTGTWLRLSEIEIGFAKEIEALEFKMRWC